MDKNLNRKTKIEAVICGKHMTLVSDESKDYVMQIIDYINIKSNEFKNANSISDKILLLAINIADELFKEREKNRDLKKEILELKNKLKCELDPKTKSESESESEKLEKPEKTDKKNRRTKKRG